MSEPRFGGNQARARTPEREAKMAQHQLISAKLAARIVGVTPMRILQLARAKQIPCTMIDDGYCGQYIFRRRDMETAARQRAYWRAQKKHPKYSFPRSA